MYFIINYDIKDKEREDVFFKSVKGLGDTLFFLPHSLILYIENNEHDKDYIFKNLKSVLKEEDLFLISTVPFSNMAGWLPSSSVEWLNDHNKKHQTNN